jgi:hypothetical protein
MPILFCSNGSNYLIAFFVAFTCSFDIIGYFFPEINSITGWWFYLFNSDVLLQLLDILIQQMLQFHLKCRYFDKNPIFIDPNIPMKPKIIDIEHETLKKQTCLKLNIGNQKLKP